MRGVFENTFQNGMTSDYNVVFQPEGTYSYMKNCQLVSQDGNNLAVKDSVGNTLTFTINPPYSGTIATTGILPKILAMISFPDKLIVISTNVPNELGGYMEIGKVEYIPYGEGVQPLVKAGQLNSGYVPLYHSVNLNGSQLHRIKGFSFIENELIERIYWTDNFNEPRVFNVSDPIFTTYILSGSLIVGQQYMVLEGAVTHSGTNYGPGLTAENVFIAANANWTNLTGTTPTPKVIAYFPYQQLNFTPSRSLGNIIFNKYGTGGLFCGSKVYYYRLGKNGGAITSWSYGSSPVPVGTLNDPNYLSSPAVPYHDFVGGGTENILLASGLSTYINIENIDTSFDYIELACAEFDQLISAPRIISIVNRSNITAATMTLQHTGSVNLGTLTIGDITLFPASILKCKTMATNKNFITIANITERKEFDFDIIGITKVAFQYPMNVHYDADSCPKSGMVYSGVSPVTGVNPGVGSVTPNSRWMVTVGQPIYNGVTHQVGDVITGVTGAGNDSIDFATHAGSQARPCVTKNRYKNRLTTKRVENSIELQGTNPSNTCFWDYKSAAVHHHVAGYRSNEWERFGLLFFDLKGNPFYTKWMFDYQFPSVTTKGGLLRNDVIGAGPDIMYSLTPTGIKIGNIVLSQAIVDQISGFAIVRAPSQHRAVTQGLVTQSGQTGASPNVFRPGAYVPMAFDNLDVADKVYTFLCPDTLVGVPLNSDIGIVGDTMEEACWAQPYDYGLGIVTRGSGVAGSEQVYTKFLSCVDDGPIRTGVITYYGDVLEGQTLTNLGSGTHYENGEMHTSMSGLDTVIGTCVVGTVNYSLDDHWATGCKKSVFKLENDFLNYGPAAYGYTDNGALSRFQTQRILMNYVKTGFVSPFGGGVDGSKDTTLYISTGHFQPITTAVKAQTFNGSGYTFDDIEVFGGNCYTNLVDIGYGLWDNGFGVLSKYSYAWTFPCENNANYDLRRGRKTSNVEMYYTGTTLASSIVLLGPTSEVRLEDFSYNQGYSTEGQNVVYPSLPVNFVNSSEFIARIRYAGPKFAGETIDSFRSFAITDFKDLSYNYGEINDLNVKDDKVIVWQDLAISTVPILERQVVSGLQGDATTIGTGGVVDRFDVITSFFGTQHQWSITPTEHGFVFFDMNKKALVELDFSSGLGEVSQIFGLKAFFEEAFLEIEGSTSSDASILVNSPTFADTADRPLTGIGIISVYDPKFKMTYMCFKFFGQKSVGIIVKDFTIGYLHSDTNKCFVGFYDWFPYMMYNHNGLVLSSNDPKNTTQYIVGGGVFGLSFIPGDTLFGISASADNRDTEYICILAVTLDNVNKYPLGASGATYWTLINKVNQLWVNNQPINLTDAVAGGYVYNKWFGKVVDNEVIPIINPKDINGDDFEVQSIVQNGPFNVNYTDIYISADNQLAADNSITSTDTNYRFVRDEIRSTMPLSATGRITNKYLKIRLVKKNWSTNPTVISTSVKILRSITSFFNTKK